MNDLTPENFESTEFILKHNVLLNRSTVTDATLRNLRAHQRAKYHTPKREIVERPTHTVHQWLEKNTLHETRRFDCLHSTEFVDTDPIPELFPEHQMWYMATTFDPDTATAFPGVTDKLDTLYRSKFGPGTPQAFMYETPIIGWVMYYDLWDTTWIVEVQGNNTLRGGILGKATGRRHFYRHLLRDFLIHTAPSHSYMMLTYEEQLKIHKELRPDGPLPPSTPYRHEVMEWCGFEKRKLADIGVYLEQHKPIGLITKETEVWYLEVGAWGSV